MGVVDLLVGFGAVGGGVLLGVGGLCRPLTTSGTLYNTSGETALLVGGLGLVAGRGFLTIEYVAPMSSKVSSDL